MKTEMDVMRLDERQQLCWLQANRVTLMLVGIVWLGMIVWELARGAMPYFLVAMVPVIALVRFVAYKYFARRA